MAMDLVKQQGGVGNLINQLQQGGLGDALSSWVSNQSSNLPVSGQRSAECVGQRYGKPNRAKIRRGCRSSRRFVGKSIA